MMELVLIELGVLFDATHSFHLHGGNFRVVAMEVVSRGTWKLEMNVVRKVTERVLCFSHQGKSLHVCVILRPVPFSSEELRTACERTAIFLLTPAVPCPQVNTAGVTRQEIIDMDQRGEIKRKLDKAPIKDTVVTMDGGYVILRFHATNPGAFVGAGFGKVNGGAGICASLDCSRSVPLCNSPSRVIPGFWLFHCHYNFHQRIGMALVIQVGEPEDFPKKPKNFPTCGNFEYEVGVHCCIKSCQ